MIMGGNEEGGLENHVVALSNALAKQNEVHVIAHQKYENRFEKVHFHSVDLTKSRNNPLLLLSIRKIITQISPHIIHAQANKAVSILAKLKPYLSSNMKLVATLHSLKKNLAAYEKFDWVIGVSHSVLAKLENQNRSVIYNGVSFSEARLCKRNYLDEQFNIPENKRIIVSIGRLVEVKRFDVLIAAFQGMQNAYLLIIGEGKERKKLEQLLSHMKKHNIQLVGQRDDNIEILSAADACVISSEREGFSYVMAESLLAGTPVVSTDVADMKRIIPKNSVVEVNNVDQLNKVLKDAVDNYDDFYGSYGPVFKWARDRFCFEKMLGETEQVYRDITH